MFKQSIKRSLFAIEKIRKFNPQVQLFLRYSQPASLSNVHKLDSQPTNLDSVSVKLIKNTLEKNGCSFEDGFTCISTQCTNCHKEKCGSIFINKVTGFFICLECQEYGSWENIATKIKMQTKENESSDDDVKKKKHKKVNIVHEGAAEWEAITMRCKSVSTLTTEELQNVFSSFHLNARNLEILKKLDAYIDESRKNLYFPLISKKKIVGVKTLFKNNKEQCFPPKQCMGILKYISNLCKRKCDSAILVLSIRDTIAVCNMNPNVHVIHLPYGTVSLPQEILPLLEPYKKLILWFGNDLISLNAARTFSKKLGEQRCFLIRKINHSPSELIEHSEHVDISQIIKSAQPVVHKSIVTFSNLREDIWSELTNIDKAQGVKWKRFPALNEYVRGHRRGELTILTGPTGCGKTTFLSEYSLDLVLQGVSTLWGSFEIRNQRLALTMLQQMVQCPIHENLENFNSWADEFERLPLYFLKFHGPQPIKEVMEVIEHATYVNDIQHLVIDNLQFMMGLSANQDKFIDRFYKQDLVIAEFRTFATLRNCHVTLIIHPRKEKETDELNISSIFGGAKATQEADNIFIIQKKTLPSLHIKKYLQIVKNRYTGELGIVPLSFNKSSLSFAGKHPKEK